MRRLLIIIVVSLTACTAPDPPAPTNTVRPLPTDAEAPPLVLDADNLGTARADELTNRALTASPTASPTRTPGPTPTTTPTSPTINSSALPVIFGVGVRASESIARLGMGTIEAESFSPDGGYWAVGTSIGIYLYDMQTMNQRWAWPTRSAVKQVEWSPDGAQIALRLEDWPNILIWDAQSGTLDHRLEDSVPVSHIAWSPDGRYIASGLSSYFYEGDHNISMWDVASESRRTLAFPEDDSPILWSTIQIAWLNEDSRIIALIGRDIRVIDLETDQIVRTITPPPECPHCSISHLSVNPDRTRFVSYSGLSYGDVAGGNSNAHVWDIASGEHIHTLEHTGWTVVYAGWSPDGSVILTSTANEVLVSDVPSDARIWDSQTGELIGRFDEPIHFDKNVRWSSDNRSFIAGGPKGEIIQWDVGTGDYQSLGFAFDGLESYGPAAYITSLAPTEWLIWNLEAGQPYAILNNPFAKGVPIWSERSDSLRIVPILDQSQVSDIYPFAYLWEPFTGNIVVESEQTADLISEDDLDALVLEYLSCGNYDPLKFYQKGGYGLTVSGYSSDDSSEANIVVTVTRASDGMVLQRFEHLPSTVICLELSPDGGLLAMSFAPGIADPSIVDNYPVMVWDMEFGQLIHEFTGHTRYASALAWSPDGNYLATSSADGTTLIWDINRAEDE